MKHSKVEDEYGLLTIHDYISTLNRFGLNDEIYEKRLRRVIGYNLISLTDSLYQIIAEEKGNSRGLVNHYKRLTKRANDIITN